MLDEVLLAVRYVLRNQNVIDQEIIETSQRLWNQNAVSWNKAHSKLHKVYDRQMTVVQNGPVTSAF